MPSTFDPYLAAEKRYELCPTARAGRTGLILPKLSLGLWHNFGEGARTDVARAMLRAAFDGGCYHFDLANNYGPPPGSAETLFGTLWRSDFGPYRDELIISTKAGYRMWPGPHGQMGSRKYLLASLDQSLRRMQLDYVDIFYSHRFDPETPLEETIGALAQAVRSGKAIYGGISNYPASATAEASALAKAMGLPLVLHQPRYSMLDRRPETEGVLAACATAGLGVIVFSPLEQGLLTDRYVDGVPPGSRAAQGVFLNEARVHASWSKINALREVARDRGQPLAHLALQWCLRRPEVTSVLIGASSVAQLEDNLAAVRNLRPIYPDEEARLDTILRG